MSDEELPDHIEIRWTIDDITDRCNHLGVEISDLAKRKILQSLKQNHDASHGITWDVVDGAIIDH